MEIRYLARAAVLPADRLITPFGDHHVTPAGDHVHERLTRQALMPLARGAVAVAFEQPVPPWPRRTISEVSRWLGHKSITTTVDLYGHLVPRTAPGTGRKAFALRAVSGGQHAGETMPAH
jgi:hypothetical protein